MAITEIAPRLRVSKGSVSCWVRDIKIHARRRRRIITEGMKRGWMKHSKIIEQRHHTERKNGARMFGKMTKNKLKVAGIALYCGEGSKGLRGNGNVILTNTNPQIMRVWIRFLTDIMKIPISEIKIRVFVYPDLDINEVRKYWLNETNLPESCWRRHTIKKSLGSKRRSNYGIAHVGIYSIEVKMKIYGMMDAMYQM